jgi:hypothetical protein
MMEWMKTISIAIDLMTFAGQICALVMLAIVLRKVTGR